MRKRDLTIYLLAVALTFYAINAKARIWLGFRSKTLITSDPRVLPLSKDPAKAAAVPSGKQVMLLMGSSHIYALPGLTPSAPLREESDKTMIYELARRLPGDNIAFLRLAQPNFLAFEMLSCVESLRQHGHHFDTVILGVSWQNLAHGRQMRHAIEQLYRNAPFVDFVRRDLAEPQIDAAPDVLTAVDEAQQQMREQAEKELQLSHADALERKINADLQDHVFLLGHSEALRARIYRLFVVRTQAFFIKQMGEDQFQYGVVDSDLDFNLKCMFALLRIFAQDGTRVMLYLDPDRPDMPPLIDGSNKAPVVAKLKAKAKELGFSVVDASDAVPAEDWGWADGLKDRGHFLEPGHALLAKLLFDEGESHQLWTPLEPPGTGSH